MAAQSVAFVSMPWMLPTSPSIQTGILKKAVERTGIACTTYSFAIDWYERLRIATRDFPDPFVLDDYREIADRYHDSGVGEWVFAAEACERRTIDDEAYKKFLREKKRLPAALIDRAEKARRLVPDFIGVCADQIIASGASLVGFSTMCSQTMASLALARVLKMRRRSLKVIFGGANCAGPMGASILRRYPWVDAVLRGEAEGVIAGIVEDVLRGVRVALRPGLCVRDGRNVTIAPTPSPPVEMEQVPIPDYDDYFDRLRRCSVHEEIEPSVTILFEASRGCWWAEKHQCRFCGVLGENLRYRSKSPQRVFEEIVELSRRYRRRSFAAVDNVMGLDYLHTLLPRLRDSAYDFRIAFEVRPNLKRRDFRLLAEAGVLRVQAGIESLSSSILKRMGKGVTALDGVRTLKWCAEEGVQVSWNIICGIPGEPPDEYARMATLVQSLTHLDPPYITLLGVDRFSPYYCNPEQYGIEVTGPLEFYRYLYENDGDDLMDLAYSFEYRHRDGRNPIAYRRPLVDAVRRWRDVHPIDKRALRCYRGPGFVTIIDRRSGSGPSQYVLDGIKRELYLGCESGTTADQLAARVSGETEHEGVSAGAIRGFLDDLVRCRLAIEVEGRYLSLALMANGSGHSHITAAGADPARVGASEKAGY